MKSIYFDNNATTAVHPDVLQAMLECYESGPANPSSLHAAGRRASERLEEARATVAHLLGATGAGHGTDRVIFTSGATEANNLALRGMVPAEGTARRIVISSVEHPSVAVAAASMESEGWQLERLGVDRNGVIDVDRFLNHRNADTALVSVILGNHETGVLQPIAQLAAGCASVGLPVHTDAVQAVGKIPVSFRDLGVTALSCSAHKFHGPPGIGALIIRHDALRRQLILGGPQQFGLRAGSEPVALAVGMAKALAIWDVDQTRRKVHLGCLRDRFEAGLRQGWPEIVVHGAEVERLPHVSCVSFPGLDRQQLLMALDLRGVACSAGSACASGASTISPVLLAMGCEPALARAALRFSFGAFNEISEVDHALQCILKICNNLRSRSRS